MKIKYLRTSVAFCLVNLFNGSGVLTRIGMKSDNSLLSIENISEKMSSSSKHFRGFKIFHHAKIPVEEKHLLKVDFQESMFNNSK